MSAFTPLEMERLRIRQFVPDDWQSVHAYTGDAQTMHFVEAHPMTEAQTRQFIAENMGDEAKHFAIELRDERRLLGHLGFHPWFSTHTYEIGWVLTLATMARGTRPRPRPRCCGTGSKPCACIG